MRRQRFRPHEPPSTRRLAEIPGLNLLTAYIEGACIDDLLLSRAMGLHDLSLDDLRAQLQARSPTLAPEKIDTALALLTLPTKRTFWQSESRPNASVEEASACLEAWEELAAEIEPLLITDEPAYVYTWHPLSALVVASHFLWHWWELRTAAPLIERATELALRAQTPSGELILHRSALDEHIFGQQSMHKFYNDASFYQVGWYYLAEIAETEGRAEDALAWFERFLKAEGSFAPLADFDLSEDFYYCKHYPPNTVEACRRGGRLAEAIGKRGRARALYNYAINLGATRFTPRRERAAMLREEGSEHLALADECAYLDGLLTRYQWTLPEFSLFAGYLDLAERCSRAGAQGLSEVARLRAVDALRRTYSYHQLAPPEVLAEDLFVPPPSAIDRLMAELNAATERGERALAEAYHRALFDAGIGIASQGRGNRLGLPLVEAELERLATAKSWPALQSCCDALDVRIENAHIRKTSIPSLPTSDLLGELAAALALYREVDPSAP